MVAKYAGSVTYCRLHTAYGASNYYYRAHMALVQGKKDMYVRARTPFFVHAKSQNCAHIHLVLFLVQRIVYLSVARTTPMTRFFSAHHPRDKIARQADQPPTSSHMWRARQNYYYYYPLPYVLGTWYGSRRASNDGGYI